MYSISKHVSYQLNVLFYVFWDLLYLPKYLSAILYGAAVKGCVQTRKSNFGVAQLIFVAPLRAPIETMYLFQLDEQMDTNLLFNKDNDSKLTNKIRIASF